MAERHEAARLSALLDDELSEAAALAVTRHVAGCADCHADLEGLRAARAAVRGLPNVAPPVAMLSGVADEARRRRHRRRRIAASAVLTLSVVTATTLAAFVMGRDRGTVVPPVELYLVDHVARMGGGPVIVPVNLGDAGG